MFDFALLILHGGLLGFLLLNGKKKKKVSLFIYDLFI